MNRWLILILVALFFLVVFLIIKRFKLRQPGPPASYGGAIRFTDPSGRNMKIIRKDDGTFETIEE